MIVTTTSTVHGLRISRTLGLVRGNTIRTRHLGKDVLAILRNLVGGEVPEYTKMMAESREQAIDRMLDEARTLGANGVICVRFQTSEIMKGASEIMCYGTAVMLEPAERVPEGAHVPERARDASAAPESDGPLALAESRPTSAETAES